MEGKRKAEDKMNMVNVITVGVVGVLLVWVSIVALQAYYKSTLDAEEQRRMTANQDVQLRETRSAQQAVLSGYTTRSSAAYGKQLAVIPIDRAMDLVLAEAKADPGASLAPEAGTQDKATIEAVPPFALIKAEAPAAPPAPPAAPTTPPAAPTTPPSPTPAPPGGNP